MNKKIIRTTITLVGDTFEQGNPLVTEDLRTRCVINFGNGSVVPHAEVTIYGLNLPAMLKLTRIRWQDIRSLQNVIKVEAGEQGDELKTVYEGNITFGYIDMSNAPDVAFSITSSTAALNLYLPASPSTFPGEVAVVDAITEIATGLGYEVENNGVPKTLKMTDVTLIDTDLNKIRALCRRYQIDLYVEQNRISIAPQGVPRRISIPVLSPASGMIGYPIATMQGVDVRSLYNPSIRFGGVLRIADSIIENCNGDWRVFGVILNLESEMPNGNWFMDIRATHNEPNNAAISR